MIARSLVLCLISIQSTLCNLCFSWISSLKSLIIAQNANFSHFWQFSVLTVDNAYSEETQENLKTDNIHIEIDFDEDTQDLHEECFLLSSTISFLRYCCIRCKPTWISRWLQFYHGISSILIFVLKLDTVILKFASKCNKTKCFRPFRDFKRRIDLNT